jgi:catechol 2,3-dioxygenase-like lactoylglutathione lyase family enzyme
MRVQGVHHLALKVPSLETAEAFYGGTLGLTVRERLADEDGQPRAIWLDLGGGAFLALELAPRLAAGSDDRQGWHCVALGIEMADRERWRRRLEAAGHRVFMESRFTLYVRDPDGALVALSHHPEPAPVTPDGSSRSRSA